MSLLKRFFQLSEQALTYTGQGKNRGQKREKKKNEKRFNGEIRKSRERVGKRQRKRGGKKGVPKLLKLNSCEYFVKISN